MSDPPPGPGADGQPPGGGPPAGPPPGGYPPPYGGAPGAYPDQPGPYGQGYPTGGADYYGNYGQQGDPNVGYGQSGYYPPGDYQQQQPGWSGPTPPPKKPTGAIIAIVAVVVLAVAGVVGFVIANGGDETADDDDNGTSSSVDTDPDPDPDPIPTSVFDLEEGDCFQSVSQTGSIEEVDVVDCDSPHDNEVYSVWDFADGPDDPYPGDDVVVEESSAGCNEDFEDQIDDTSDLSISSLHPTEGSWGNGDREVVCYLQNTDGSQLTGPV